MQWYALSHRYDPNYAAMYCGMLVFYVWVEFCSKKAKNPIKLSLKVDFVQKKAEHSQMLLSLDYAPKHCAKRRAVSSRGKSLLLLGSNDPLADLH